MGYGFIYLEELQTMLRELLAELRCDGEREKFLVLPFLPDQSLQACAA